MDNELLNEFEDTNGNIITVEDILAPNPIKKIMTVRNMKQYLNGDYVYKGTNEIMINENVNLLDIINFRYINGRFKTNNIKVPYDAIIENPLKRLINNDDAEQWNLMKDVNIDELNSSNIPYNESSIGENLKIINDRIKNFLHECYEVIANKGVEFSEEDDITNYNVLCEKIKEFNINGLFVYPDQNIVTVEDVKFVEINFGNNTYVEEYSFDQENWKPISEISLLEPSNADKDMIYVVYGRRISGDIKDNRIYSYNLRTIRGDV